MISCPGGATRHVFLVGPYAIKIPQFRYGWKNFLYGLLANLQERTFAKAGWPELCPVAFSLPGGWLVVMQRAEPLTREEWFSFDSLDFCEREGREYCIPAERKMDSFGKNDGRIVAVDYGGFGR